MQDKPSPRPQRSVELPAVGASVEVLRHHGQRHFRDCQAQGSSERICPYARAAALLHGGGELLFLAMAPIPPCDHARELWAA
jgi:hypothetical protein